MSHLNKEFLKDLEDLSEEEEEFKAVDTNLKQLYQTNLL